MEVSVEESPVDLSVHPNDGKGKPTTVYLNVILQKIGAIRTADSEVDVKIKFNMHWHDPRMLQYKGDPSKLPGDLWGPRMDCPSGTSSFSRIEERPMALKNKETGHLMRTFIFEGTINNSMDLRNFPLDHDNIEMKFTCVSSMSASGEIHRLQNETHVEWVSLAKAPRDIRSAFPHERFFNIAYWNRQLTEWDFHSFWYSLEKWHAPSGIYYAQLILRFRVYRKTGYYFSKILFPLSLLFFFCMTIFVYEPNDFENRMSLGSTMFLAVVAFLYVVGADLPKVGYLTKMDYCIMFEMVSQIVSIAISVAIRLANWNNDVNSKVNWIGAVISMSVYVLGVTLSMGIAMIHSARSKSQVSRDKSLPEETLISVDII